MGIQISITAALLIASGLLLLALYTFSRVRSDYRSRGSLTRPGALLQTGFFIAYALSSYLFLDSRLTAIASRGAVLVIAVLLMIAGLAIVLLSMPFLGRRSFGQEIGKLHTKGIYQYSRNPQLVGGFLFVVGYALLWPSWPGLLWASLWLPVSYLMVGAEEEHLRQVFGDEYTAYCRCTPRYVGLPR
jgi:protein-S-isoprenylcysteine O-methyltransferase Ste14